MNSTQLVNLLIENKMRICCAESCTGGMLSSAIVDVPNASSVLDMGFVTYANTAKMKLLNVDPKTIAQYGVVSEAVAGQMAIGAARVSGADVGVGISGIAGPTGATAGKPVGTVCFGFWIKGVLTVTTQHFDTLDRTGVRIAAVNYAIDTLIDLLQ